MAAHARAEVTLVDQTDADALVTWYRLATSATRPPKPTTTAASATPSGWSKAEPAYSGGSTSYLYTCLQLVWGDGTCDWGDVQLSSSYEAAKAAWNKAQAAADAAAATANYFWHDSGGAHVSTVAGSTATGDSATLASGALSFASGGTELARFGAELVSLIGGAVTLSALDAGERSLLIIKCGGWLTLDETTQVNGDLYAHSVLATHTGSDTVSGWQSVSAGSLWAHGNGGVLPVNVARIDVDTSNAYEVNFGDGTTSTVSPYYEGAPAASQRGIFVNGTPVSLDGHSHAWELVGSATGAGSCSYDLSGRSEALVTCAFDGYLGSAVLPVAALTSSQQEVYLGGGYYVSGPGGRRVICRASLTRLTGVMANKDETNVTSQAAWSVYAR